jgi:transketolase
MRTTFVKSLLEIAKKDPNVLLVTGDLGFGVLNPFWEELPKQIINVGIAEQNMIGFAAGLALQKKIVYVYSIANFPTLRPLEQIRNDVAYHNLNVKIVSVGAGFSYGSLGMSHHAIEDVSVIRSIPNIKIYSPFSDFDTNLLTNLSYNERGPIYLRLGRKSAIIESDPTKLVFRKNFPFIFNHNSTKVIVTYGDITEEVYKAYFQSLSSKIFFDLYIFHTLRPIDDSIFSMLSKYKEIIVIEEHSRIGGLSSIIKDNFINFNNLSIRTLAINDEFRFDVGDQNYLRSIHGLDSTSILKFLNNL